MRTKYLLVLVLFIIGWRESEACDACGCGIMGQPNGLLANYRRTFLSAGYQQAEFHGTPGLSSEGVDVFHTLDLSFDYYLTDRWRTGIYIPYRINTRTIDQEFSQVKGWSDIRMETSYTFLSSTPSSGDWEIYLEAGAGLILPSGRYDPSIHDSNLPENFNPGKGSFGYTFNQTNGISWKKVGTVIRNAWTDFAATPDGYAYGAQWATSFLMLVDLPIDTTFSVVPLASIQFENVWEDHYANGLEVHGTGGQGVFMTAGSQLKLRDWLFTFQYAFPLSGHYSSGEVTAGHRFSLQLTHLF